MNDPGVSLKATTLAAAFALLQSGLGRAPLDAADAADALHAAGDDAEEAIEALGLAAGLRSRRVILEAGWWNRPGMPMVARVDDRRRAPREEPPGPAEPTGTGWVALVPRGGAYRMRAAFPGPGDCQEWTVDAAVAARLVPFAYTLHDRFPARALGTRDVVGFAFRAGAPDLAALCAAGTLAALLGLLTPVATGWLVDRAIPAGDGARVAGLVAALAVAGLAIVALEALRAYAALRFESRIALAMQAALVDRVVSAPAHFLRRFASGDLALRMGSVNTVQRVVTGSTVGSFVTALFLLANVAMMARYAPTLWVAALGVALALVAISATLGLRRLRVGPRIEALDGRLEAFTFEMYGGIAKLRAAAAEDRAFDQWYARYDEFRNASRVATGLANRETVALGLLYPAATAVVFALAWRALPSAGLTPGDFVAFHTAMFALLGGVHLLVSTVLDVVNLKPVWDRARPLLEAPPEDAARGKRHAPRGGIALEGVRFAYPGGPEVLEGIDLEVAPGEFVALVGPSGSGKSTLLRLLLGFERPTSGTVRFDGHDLATLDLRHLRMRIGTVLQGGRLWAGDLLANIVGATNLGPEEAMAAARRAGFAADIEALPMGLYTVVGEGLSTLSGGQRQRVLLARALIGRPAILLLDEATSALDNVAQAAVLQDLATLEATRVVIAHRLSTVRHADRIVVIEAGRIVQQGAWAELANVDGPFATMLRRQSAARGT